MEHRWSARQSVTGNVVVENSRLGKIRGTLLDISLGGMLVETGAIALPLNAPVAVAFNLSPEDHGGAYRLHAMVVRHFQTAAGLMFQDLDIDTVRTLRTLLRPASEAALQVIRAA